MMKKLNNANNNIIKKLIKIIILLCFYFSFIFTNFLFLQKNIMKIIKIVLKYIDNHIMKIKNNYICI